MEYLREIEEELVGEEKAYKRGCKLLATFVRAM